MISLSSMKTVKYVPIFLLVVSFVFSGTATADESAVKGLEEYKTKIDSLAERAWRHGKAISLLNEAMENFPDNDELLWRVSRSYADSAEVLQIIEHGDEDSIVNLYEAAVKYADRAIEINPENSMAYTRRAIATGQIALYKGIWSAVSLVKQTRDAVEKALELDDKNATAHFVYARSHSEVSRRSRLVRGPLGLGWASMDTGLEHFEKAVELRPDFIRFRLDAASAFQRDKKNAKAIEILEPVADLKIQAQLDFIYREQAAELLAELRD